MRYMGKSVPQLFQKGILISTLSMQSLYQHLKNKYNITYILTHRLNPDSLESFFSQIRDEGALNRMKIIMLGKNPGMVQKNHQLNEEAGNKEYIVANAIRRAGVKVGMPEIKLCVLCTSVVYSSSNSNQPDIVRNK